MPQSTHSIIVPVYNEESVIPELKRRLDCELIEPIQRAGDEVEILLVDDGSSDRSAEMIAEVHRSDPKHYKLLSFSRNFGHQTAITAGLDYASGDTITTIDADLQDPPSVVLLMIAEWRKGFEVVYGRREKRKSETVLKKATAALFYRILKASTQLEIPIDTGDFRLMSRRAAHGLASLREQHRFVRGLAAWVGYRQTFVTYVRDARHSGETKYPLRKMFKLAWDAFTGFSLAPLRVASWIGISAAFFALLTGLWAIYSRYFTRETIPGWTSIMIVVLFFGGVQLFSIGILGEYVGRIFEQIKQRPLYLVGQTLGDFPRKLYP